VARRRFLAEQRELVRRFVAANRELTEMIRQNPEQAQRMLRDEMKASFRADLSAELTTRAWPRMTPTADVSLDVLQSFVTSAKTVGFLRDIPDLSRLIEKP
jgi:NitT/TauT family transport system substrate-binding protein